MERSDDVSQLDGLPRRWPHQGINSEQEQATPTSVPNTPTGEDPRIDPNSLSSDPRRTALPPAQTVKPADSAPDNAATHDGQLVSSREVLNKPLPEAPSPPEHSDNPDDLKEHLAAVPPVSSKRTTSSALEDPGIKDLGWRDDAPRPVQLIRGIDNEDVSMLIRRFNKVCNLSGFISYAFLPAHKTPPNCMHWSVSQSTLSLVVQFFVGSYV